MGAKLGRKPTSPLGRKQQYSILLLPEEAAALKERYGTVQKGIRALLAEASPPRPAPPDAPPCPPPTLCERCTRIGVPACHACRGTVHSDS